MNTIQEQYNPLTWDLFDESIMRMVYRAESHATISLGKVHNKVCTWNFSLDQQQLEQKCEENQLQIKYSKAYRKGGSNDINAEISFPMNLSPDIEYHRLMQVSRDRYGISKVAKTMMKKVAVIDTSIVFPSFMSDNLRLLAAPLYQDMLIEIEELYCVNNILQRRIDTIHFNLQLGTNNGNKRIDVYNSFNGEDVLTMQKYVSEKGYKTEICSESCGLYDVDVLYVLQE